MSVSEDSVSCPIENSVTVHLETVQNSTNVHSCDVEEETQTDTELLKGMLTDTFCQVCEAVLMFESQKVSHYEGKKHAQRVRIYLQSKKAERNKQSHESDGSQVTFNSVGADPERFCQLCNMVFTSPVVAKSHYRGKVHAKNMRKSSATSSVDARATVSPSVTAVEDTAEVSTQDDVAQDRKESTASAAQGVDLSDPDKYCKLCTASFNNPTMAAEHYSGRKHQRNLARQAPQSQLEEENEHVNSLTCPLCHVTLSSIDAYQAHMKGNKHQIKEKTTQEDASKKKVYDSFQDELADYIQVQRARGLEPKTGQGSEMRGQRKAEHEEDEIAERCDQPQILSLQPRLPAPAFRPPPWRPPVHPHPNSTPFRGRFPAPNQWEQGYSPYPPPLIPGLTGRALRRGRSPESFSSSFSDSSSSYSSSSSEDSKDKRKRRKRRRVGIKRRGGESDDSEEDAQKKRKERRRRDDGSTKKPKRRRESSDEEHGKTRKEKKQKGKDGKKRRKEEDNGEWNRVPQVAITKGEGEGEVQSEGIKEEKSKHKKEKKVKGREDNRTEEEKLWDETILGVFC